MAKKIQIKKSYNLRITDVRGFFLSLHEVFTLVACDYTCCVATLLWPSVGVKPNTSKVGDLESSGTPECLGFDSKAQNTSH
jgi:hypothetical protein